MTTFVTLAEAYHKSNYETWSEYWKQCRVQSLIYKWPLGDPESEENPIHVRWREIPEGEDVNTPHPDLPIHSMETPAETSAIKALLEVLPDDHAYKTFERIEKASEIHHETLYQRDQDFTEFLEYKKNGNLKIETIDETQPITWNSIRNATTEELFQTKLEIFESSPVQESNNKEWRQNIRKADSIIEAMYWYYLIVNGSSDSDEAEKKAEEKFPEFIDKVIDEEFPSEIIFKYKLQIFEKEHVQNSKNKKARSKIRKSTNLVELLAAYSEILNDSKKE